MNTPALFNPITNFEEAEKLLTQIHDKFNAIPVGEIKSVDERVDVGNALREAKTLQKRLKDVETELKKPAKDYVKTIDEMLAPSETVLDRVSKTYSDIILAWDRLAIAKRQDEERAKAQAEKERLETAAIDAEIFGTKTESRVLANAATKVVAPVVTNLRKEDHVGTTIRKVKKWRVLDLSLVPREYLCLDEKAVNAACKTQTPIEGIEYFDEEVTVTRGAY